MLSLCVSVIRGEKIESKASLKYFFFILNYVFSQGKILSNSLTNASTIFWYNFTKKQTRLLIRDPRITFPISWMKRSMFVSLFIMGRTDWTIVFICKQQDRQCVLIRLGNKRVPRLGQQQTYRPVSEKSTSFLELLLLILILPLDL